MDYQLFLLAAIRERYEATGDTKRAIAGDKQQQIAQLRLCFFAQGGANVRFGVAHY